MKGRKKTAGRYESRAELVAHVAYLWTVANFTQAEIAKIVGVAKVTVLRIVDGLKKL